MALITLKPDVALIDTLLWVFQSGSLRLRTKSVILSKLITCKVNDNVPLTTGLRQLLLASLRIGLISELTVKLTSPNLCPLNRAYELILLSRHYLTPRFLSSALS